MKYPVGTLVTPGVEHPAVFRVAAAPVRGRYRLDPVNPDAEAYAARRMAQLRTDRVEIHSRWLDAYPRQDGGRA